MLNYAFRASNDRRKALGEYPIGITLNHNVPNETFPIDASND